MFEPFYADKDICPGIGSGLAMVYDTVKQSGGYIFVDSKVGKEITFKSYLPRVEKEVGLSEKDKLFKQIPKVRKPRCSSVRILRAINTLPSRRMRLEAHRR